MSAVPVAGGSVVIAGRSFYVRQLSLEAERALGLQYRQKIKDAAGPGGYFGKCQAALEYLNKTNPAAFAISVNRLIEMEANGDLPGGEPVEAYRQTPEGVALEVFTRTRSTHGEVSLAEIKAIITEANALDVHLQIIKVLTDEGKA